MSKIVIKKPLQDLRVYYQFEKNGKIHELILSGYTKRMIEYDFDIITQSIVGKFYRCWM